MARIEQAHHPKIQPLPLNEANRPVIKFQAHMARAEAAPVAAAAGAAPAPKANEALPPLPAAPLFNRHVAAEAPRPHPEMVVVPRPEVAAARRPEAAPTRLQDMMREVQGRAALAPRQPAGAAPAAPAPRAAMAPARPPVVAPAAAEPAPRAAFSHTAAVNVEVQQLHARDVFQQAVTERQTREEGGVGMVNRERMMVDQRL